jgi:VWFA-related protein
MLQSLYRFFTCLSLCMLFFVSANSQILPQSEDQETIKLKTDLVVVDAVARDKKSREIIRGLKLQDFELFEDGAKQQIEFFGQDKLPISLVLLLDISGSVRPVIEKVREGALQTLQRLKSEDEVALMVFSGWTELIQDFTRDRELVQNKLSQALEKTGGGTRIHEAILKAARQTRHSTNPLSRRAILVITDNQGYMSRYDDNISEQDVRQTLIESGATVCGVIVRSILNVFDTLVFQPMSSDQIKRTTINPSVEETGGEITGASKEDINIRLGEMIEHLRSRYSLGYTSTNQVYDGRYRKVTVALSPEAKRRLGNDVLVNARKGYYAVDKEMEELLAQETADAKPDAPVPEIASTSSDTGLTANPVKAENPPLPVAEKTAENPPIPVVEKKIEPPDTKRTEAPSPVAKPEETSQPAVELPVQKLNIISALNPDAGLVMVDVYAVNKKTRATANNLTREDFMLLDNGVKKEITHFSYRQKPLSVILLIDVSGNTSYTISSLRRGVGHWLRQIKPEDEIALMAFGAYARTVQDFTKDRKQVAVKLKDFFEKGRELNLGPNQDRTMAINQAAEHMEKAANPGGRRVIITITDDRPSPFTGANTDYTDKLLFDTGTVVYAMVAEAPRPSPARKILSSAAKSAIYSFGNPVSIVTSVVISVGSQMVIDTILNDRSFTRAIRKTGGVAMKLEGEESAEKLDLLLELIHNRYVIGFAPPGELANDNYHKLVLKVKPGRHKRAGGIVITTAEGYYVSRPVRSLQIDATDYADAANPGQKVVP